MSDKCSQCGRISNTWDAFGKCPHCNFSPPDAGEKGAGPYKFNRKCAWIEGPGIHLGLELGKDYLNYGEVEDALNAAFLAGKAAGAGEREKAIMEREQLWLEYKKTRDFYDIAASATMDNEALASDWDTMRALKAKRDELIKKLGETAPRAIARQDGEPPAGGV